MSSFDSCAFEHANYEVHNFETKRRHDLVAVFLQHYATEFVSFKEDPNLSDLTEHIRNDPSTCFYETELEK